MAIAIRRATLDDVPQIVELLRTTHTESSFAECAPFDDESTTGFAEGMITEDNGEIVVAADGGNLVGLISFIYISPYFNKHAKIAYAIVMWVDKQYAKLQIGRKLYKAGIAMIANKGCQYLDISVPAKNTGLIKFHERYGAVVNEVALRTKVS